MLLGLGASHFPKDVRRQKMSQMLSNRECAYLGARHLLNTGKTQYTHMEEPEAQELSELLGRLFDGLAHLSTI